MNDLIITDAKREALNICIGLWSPSGGGKTYSALRLASGVQRIFGGDIFVVDTENKRSKQYADEFKFKHIDLQPPFSTQKYLDTLVSLEKHNPGVVVFDSFSHEHDWMLEEQVRVAEELSNRWNTSIEKANPAAWGKVKKPVKDLANYLERVPYNIILCFKAKEKTVITKKNGKTSFENIGHQPIASKEYVYAMTISAFLPPGSEGKAHFYTGKVGEDMMTKLIQPVKNIFNQEGIQLSEDIGERLAKWAAGDEKPAPKKQAAEKKPAATLPAIHAELKGYLDSGKVADRKVTIRGKEVSLLEKAEGALSHIEKNAEGWGESTPGYSDIQAVIGFIKEDLEPKAEAPEAAGAPELEIF